MSTPLATSLRKLADSLVIMQEYEQAKSYYDMAVNSFKEASGDMSIELYILHANLVICHMLTNEYDKCAIHNEYLKTPYPVGLGDENISKIEQVVYLLVFLWLFFHLFYLVVICFNSILLRIKYLFV